MEHDDIMQADQVALFHFWFHFMSSFLAFTRSVCTMSEVNDKWNETKNNGVNGTA